MGGLWSPFQTNMKVHKAPPPKETCALLPSLTSVNLPPERLALDGFVLGASRLLRSTDPAVSPRPSSDSAVPSCRSPRGSRSDSKRTPRLPVTHLKFRLMFLPPIVC